MAGFGQNLMRPRRAPVDGEAGGSIAAHGLSASVLEERFGSYCIGTKLVRALIEDLGVLVSMAPDLVAAIGDLAHQIRMALGDPAQGEEGGGDLVFGQQPKQPVGVGLHPGSVGTPARPVHDVFERHHLEVVLDVDAHRVHDGLRPGVLA